MSQELRLIAMDFVMDFGDLGEHPVNVWGSVEISEPEPSLGLGPSIDASPVQIVCKISNDYTLRFDIKDLSPALQSNLTANLEEFIRECLESGRD